MSYGPDAIAHTPDGRVAFVSGAVAGDRVLAEITEEQERFVRAHTTEILEAGAHRTDAKCPLVGVCGGCPWGALSREFQLASKRDAVVDALVRIGHFKSARAQELVSPTDAPSEEIGYRNKVELAVAQTGGRAMLGMHKQGSSELVAVKECPLFSAKYTKAVKSVSGALGFLASRNSLDIERVGLRASKRTGELEVAIWTEPSGFPRAQAAKVLADACSPTSVVRVLQKGPAKARRVVKVERLSGKGSWAEKIRERELRFSAPSFFQVNTEGAERLVELVLEALDPQSEDLAWDLYSGAGTFTVPLAERCEFTEAIESYGPAVRDLRRNLEINSLDNVEVTGGDAAIEQPEYEPDIVVVDPPRAGLDERVVDYLSSCGARRIAYVSCDPATLARDLARFEGRGVYTVHGIQPVDLFPQTYHVECVTTLVRKDS